MATTFSSSPHPPHSPLPAHVTQVQLLDENTSSDALPASERNTVSFVCHRCGTSDGKSVTRDAAICSACYEALKQQATDQQEHDYLRRWLSTRCDERGNPHWGHTTNEQATIRRLCAKARRLNLDWTDVPPPMKFAERMKALLAPYAIDGGEAATAR